MAVSASQGQHGAIGKTTLTASLPLVPPPSAPIQARRSSTPGGEEAPAQATAGGGAAMPTGAAEALKLGMTGVERLPPHRAEVAAKFSGVIDRVRCFFGAPAQQACQMMNAQAFTVGNVIVFADDAPSVEIVVHELGHVEQQGAAPLDSPPVDLQATSPGDEHERDADARAGGSGDAPAQPTSGPRLARYEATNGDVPLLESVNGREIIRLPPNTRVVTEYNTDAQEAGFSQVEVVHGQLIGRKGFVRTDQIQAHPDEDHVIGMNLAQRLFDELAQGKFRDKSDQDQRIPFHVPEGSCFARAHMMAQLLTEKGYNSEKIFIISERPSPPNPDNGNLVIRSPYSKNPDGEVRWGYHVAPVISVNLSGRLTRFVLDPSIAQRPLTIDEWTSILTPHTVKQVPVGQLQDALNHHDEQPSPKTTVHLPPGQNLSSITNKQTYDLTQLNPPSMDHANSEFQARGIPELTQSLAEEPLREAAAVIRIQLVHPAGDWVLVGQQIQRLSRGHRQSLPPLVPDLINRARAKWGQPQGDRIEEALNAS